MLSWKNHEINRIDEPKAIKIIILKNNNSYFLGAGALFNFVDLCKIKNIKSLKTILRHLIYTSIILLYSCGSISTSEKITNKKVEVIKKENSYILYKDNVPFYVKGASGTTNLKLLKQIGGNTFRTYTTENAQQLLDEAHELGLMVILGIWIEPYSEKLHIKDTLFNERTLSFVRRKVNKYKNHPALLAWSMGNEVHPIEPNISSWKLLNEAALLTKSLDNNHPVTTCVAGYPRRNMPIIKTYLTDVDFISFNTFGGIKTFDKKLNNIFWGYNGPYLFSEWGANGYWEMIEKTTWNSPIEVFHSQTASKLGRIWRNYIIKEKDNCIGSCIFYWGQKQEFTASWYSLFSKENEKTPIIDSLANFWGGTIDNYSPQLQKLEWQNHTSTNIRIEKETQQKVNFSAIDHENDMLTYSFEIRPETSRNIDDFGYEAEPLINKTDFKSNSESVKFKAPTNPGLYRLFIKVSDNKGGCDLANLPFMVKDLANRQI